MWFRDKAYEMKKPTVDRIDSLESYTLENCRYIEAVENSKRERNYYCKICPELRYMKSLCFQHYSEVFKFHKDFMPHNNHSALYDVLIELWVVLWLRNRKSVPS